MGVRRLASVSSQQNRAEGARVHWFAAAVTDLVEFFHRPDWRHAHGGDEQRSTRFYNNIDQFGQTAFRMR